MLKRLSLEKIELILGSALAAILINLAVDLPYIPCGFFFGEPEYPTNE